MLQATQQTTQRAQKLTLVCQADCSCAVPQLSECVSVLQAAQQQLPVSQQATQQTKGLHKFVKQIVQMYGSGFTSRKMLLQQSLAGQDKSKGVSPSVISMQQNTRLAVLTLQVMSACKLQTPWMHLCAHECTCLLMGALAYSLVHWLTHGRTCLLIGAGNSSQLCGAAACNLKCYSALAYP